MMWIEVCIIEGKKSWLSFIYKSTENMKIDISKLHVSTDDISKIVNNYYKKSVEDQLKIKQLILN
jgi:hypothetical protein